MRFRQKLLLPLFCLILSADHLNAWFDETHLVIAKATGYERYYNTAAPDVAKLKCGDKEGQNHYFNNPQQEKITPELVKAQVSRYDNSDDPEGHLYGAIIASLKSYIYFAQQGKFADYNLAYCFHYIGDLSNPLHNSPYDAFNKARHKDFDGVVEKKALLSEKLVRTNMVPMRISAQNWEHDLSVHISTIANATIQLDRKIRSENRSISEQEAWKQLGLSASLCKAVLDFLSASDLRKEEE